MEKMGCSVAALMEGATNKKDDMECAEAMTLQSLVCKFLHGCEEKIYEDMDSISD